MCKNLTDNIINIENLLYLNNDKPRINYYNCQLNGIIFPHDTTHITSKCSQIKFHEELYITNTENNSETTVQY